MAPPVETTVGLMGSPGYLSPEQMGARDGQRGER